MSIIMKLRNMEQVLGKQLIEGELSTMANQTINQKNAPNEVDESLVKQYMDLRKILEEDEILSFSSYLDGAKIVVTVYTFDIPLKQIKLDLGALDDDEKQQLLKELENNDERNH